MVTKVVVICRVEPVRFASVAGRRDARRPGDHPVKSLRSNP
ncbi:hypothetical protein ACIO87_31495 [Streptomyces sp. NPDC087218]